jgi:uncharacterized DUF497 family protein
LNDPLALRIEDASAEDEPPFVTVGTNTFGTLMVVVWTPRGVIRKIVREELAGHQ